MTVASGLLHLLLVSIALHWNEQSLASSPSIDLISHGKPVSQSSEYPPVPGPAGLAVDNNRNQHYMKGRSCTHTALQVHPWWKIDLGSVYDIHRVKIWNRADCCGARLASLTIQTSNDNVNFVDVDKLKETAVNGGIYSFSRRFSGRYIRLILSKSTPEYLTLCEVEVYGRARTSGDVISQGKPTSQSSEYAPFPGPSSNAVDDDKNQDYNGKSCTHTGLQVNPWWKVDLEAVYKITAIKVWNRADCCGERLTSLMVQTSIDGETFRDVGMLDGVSVAGGLYTLNTQFTGRYVRLILSKSSPDYLTLCEVEVYGYL